MARKPMVTRTVRTTKVTFLCVNTVEEKIETKVVEVTRTYSDDKKLLKAVKEVITDENIIPVKIIKTEIVESLFGMTEQEFVEHAQILPPRGTKEEIEED